MGPVGDFLDTAKKTCSATTEKNDRAPRRCHKPQGNRRMPSHCSQRHMTTSWCWSRVVLMCTINHTALGGGFNFLLFSLRSWGYFSGSTDIFQLGWNHQLFSVTGMLGGFSHLVKGSETTVIVSPQFLWLFPFQTAFWLLIKGGVHNLFNSY